MLIGLIILVFILIISFVLLIAQLRTLVSQILVLAPLDRPTAVQVSDYCRQAYDHFASVATDSNACTVQGLKSDNPPTAVSSFVSTTAVSSYVSTNVGSALTSLTDCAVPFASSIPVPFAAGSYAAAQEALQQQKLHVMNMFTSQRDDFPASTRVRSVLANEDYVDDFEFIDANNLR